MVLSSAMAMTDPISAIRRCVRNSTSFRSIVLHWKVVRVDDGNAHDNATRDRRPLRSLITGGAEIAGGAVGGALGFPAAALGAGGTLAAMALSHIDEEIAGRSRGPREKVYVGHNRRSSPARHRLRGVHRGRSFVYHGPSGTTSMMFWPSFVRRDDGVGSTRASQQHRPYDDVTLC